MAYETIIVEIRGEIGLVKLNRPKVLNALSAEVIADLNAAADGFESNDDIAAIVLTGNERAFAAGADVGEMAAKEFSDVAHQDFFAPWQRLAECRKPLIAAVSGYALGGGCELALMCDIVIASESAKFGLPEVTIGLIPAAGGTQRLVRAVGKAKAMDMILTGRTMDAAEAERLGLVSRVVPANDVLDQALAVAERIAELSHPITRMAKESINRAFESSLAEGLLIERKLASMIFAMADRKEGMSAFVEKRQPTFSHK